MRRAWCLLLVSVLGAALWSVSGVALAEPTPSADVDTCPPGKKCNYDIEKETPGTESSGSFPSGSSLPSGQVQQAVKCPVFDSGADPVDGTTPTVVGCIEAAGFECDSAAQGPFITLTLDSGTGNVLDTSAPWCSQEESPAEAAQRAFFQLSIPVAVPSVEPGVKTYVNATTFFTADGEPRVDTVDAAGTQIMIRSTPNRWEYTWGDEAEDEEKQLSTGEETQPRIFTTAGNPVPSDDVLTRNEWYRKHLWDEEVDHTQYVTHQYRTTGVKSLQLEVQFTGEYSLDGGDTWQQIPGSTSSTSPTLRLTLKEIRVGLGENSTE